MRSAIKTISKLNNIYFKIITVLFNAFKSFDQIEFASHKMPVNVPEFSMLFNCLFSVIPFVKVGLMGGLTRRAVPETCINL